LFNPFQSKNRQYRFAEKQLFTSDVLFLLTECLKLIHTQLSSAIKLAHGGGFKSQRMIEQELAKLPSEQANRFKGLFYLLYFNEIGQVIGPVKNYRIELGAAHDKYLLAFLEQNPKTLAKFEADLAHFLNTYYATLLKPLPKEAAPQVHQTLERFSKACATLGFTLNQADRALLRVAPNPARRKVLYDAWLEGKKSRFTLGRFFKKKEPESEYSELLKKLRKQKAVRQLAELVSDRFAFGNPTKIKILITFSVILLEKVGPNLKKVIDQESSKQVRPKQFFNADFKKLSVQIEKMEGEYYEQLGKDLNAFFTAIRSMESQRVASTEEREEIAQRWSVMQKAVNQLGFDFAYSPDNKIQKLTLRTQRAKIFA